MNLQGKRAAIVTLGCKVNQYETDAMYECLRKQALRWSIRKKQQISTL